MAPLFLGPLFAAVAHIRPACHVCRAGVYNGAQAGPLCDVSNNMKISLCNAVQGAAAKLVLCASALVSAQGIRIHMTHHGL